MGGRGIPASRYFNAESRRREVAEGSKDPAMLILQEERSRHTRVLPSCPEVRLDPRFRAGSIASICVSAIFSWAGGNIQLSTFDF